MQEIELRYQPNMPAQLWNLQSNRFNKKVRAFKDGKALEPTGTRLSDGEEITFMLLIAGG